MSLEVVYNDCYGGFGLSVEAKESYIQALGLQCFPKDLNVDDIDRHDPHLVNVVKTLGERANGGCSELKIETIPIEFINHYKINEYDGYENVEPDLASLVKDKCTQLNLDNMTESDCRETLSELIRLSSLVVLD